MNPSTLIPWKFMSLKNKSNNKNNYKGNHKSSNKSNNKPNNKSNNKPNCEEHKIGIPEKLCNVL